ncbi:hypothetical protein GQR58_002015 [Nymphon striatum]|nr:hypothetical protein GQR58_002015 [Nymphon striatum]
MISETTNCSPIICLKVASKGKLINVNFLIDSGAQFSLIDADLVKSQHRPQNIITKNVTNINSKQQPTQGFNFKCNLYFPNNKLVSTTLFAKKNLHLTMYFKNIFKLVKELKIKNKLSKSFPTIKSDEIIVNGILGCDLIAQFETFQQIKYNNGKLIRLSDGCIPIGPCSDLISANSKEMVEIEPEFLKGKTKCNKPKVPRKTINQAVNFVFNTKPSYYSPMEEVFPDSDVVHGLEDFFSLESIGIKEDISSYDQNQTDKFRNSIEFRDGHYHIDLPWNEDILRNVPSNYQISKTLANKIWFNTVRKGRHNEYLKVFKEQEELGIIEEIPGGYDPDDHIWIPHHPVVKEDPLTTTKIRPVFNCSLKIAGKPSLNEAAYPGTDLMNNLLGLINYLRFNNITLISDIAKAFLMIKLKSPADKNRFSFIIYNNGKYKAYRYNTIIFGFITSPFILNFILKHHVENQQNLYLKNTLQNQFYVDNFIYTCDRSQEAVDMYLRSKEVMKQGGFDLREWNSNDQNVLIHIPKTEKSKDLVCKVLGYLYNTDDDTLGIKNKTLNIEAKTKRNILSSIASIFDPLGFLNPFIIKGKLLMRQMHQAKLDWDDKVDQIIKTEWLSFCSDFDKIKNFIIPRKTINQDKPAKLMIFCDASKEAFGFVMYAVQNNNSNFLFSKIKISPLKTKTLPTLELLSVYLALKCIKSIIKDPNFNVQISELNIFTDSQVALNWLLTGHALKKNVFVNNRLKEIKEIHSYLNSMNLPLNAHYVPTEHNVADLQTRKTKIGVFMEQFSYWIAGPDWIKGDINKWPKGSLGCISHQIKSNLIAFQFISPDLIIDSERFSKYSRLLATMTRVYEAVYRFSGRTYDINLLKQRAFEFLIKTIQKTHFTEEFRYLKLVENNAHKKQPIPPLIQHLNLYLDNKQIIRSKGRIERNLSLSYDAINPVLIHGKHKISQLIILDAHVKSGHMSSNYTINHIRNAGFWIPKVRQTIMTVLKRCYVCKKLNSKPFPYPKTPSLSKSRVNFIKPFHSTGIDYTGHFYVLDCFGAKQKVYVLLFTCLNTRGVHLEVVSTMSSDDFILAFIRFSNRYGIPREVYTDNAKTFLSSSKLLKDIVISDDFQKHFIKYQISFKTVPVYASWYAGAWERLVKIFKQVFYKTIGKRTIPYSNFITTVSDIQLILNNRPLTYCSRNNDIDIITPNHLISPGINFPSIILNEEQAEHYGNTIDDSVRVAQIRRHDGTTTTSAISNLFPLELETIFSKERIDGSPLVEDSEISNEISDESELVDRTELINEPEFPEESQLVDDSEPFSEPQINNNTIEINDEASTSNIENPRPKRKAALAFGQKLKGWLKNNLI